eukprot:1273285-Rhodomonas_salina.1
MQWGLPLMPFRVHFDPRLQIDVLSAGYCTPKVQDDGLPGSTRQQHAASHGSQRDGASRSPAEHPVRTLDHLMYYSLQGSRD